MIFVLSCLNLILAKKTNVRSKRKNPVSNNARVINNKAQIVLESAIIFCIIIVFFMFIFYKVIHPVNVMMVREYKDYMLDSGDDEDLQDKVEGRIEVTQ